MKITSGTEYAEALLERFKREGLLMDVYSEQFFNRLPPYKDNPNAMFFREGLASIEEFEIDSEASCKPKNHLLFLYADETQQELVTELLNIYPPLLKTFGEGHWPDFLIVNLYTQQILCLGFGRKNRLFAIDAMSNQSVNVFGLNSSGSTDYINKFTEHDCFECISDFIHALDDLSDAMFEKDMLPSNSFEVEYAFEAGENERGFYCLDDDSEEISKDDLISLRDSYIAVKNREDAAMSIVKLFFPDVKDWELNTGDY
jgi:hypothetical protein